MNGIGGLNLIRGLCAAVLLLAFQWAPTAVSAQEIVEAEAVAGKPYGVARVLSLVDPRTELHGALLAENQNRLHYQVSEQSTRPVRRFLRDLVGAPKKIETWFLFTGDAPLELSLPGSRGTFRVRTISNDAAHGQMLKNWWNRFATPDRRARESQDYPALIDDYLVGTLGRRLNLALPDALLNDPDPDALLHAVRVLGGAESVRGQWVRRVAAGQVPREPANAVLPPALEFPQPTVKVEASVKVEPIADRIPPELLYVRFGSFPNYLWFSHRLDEWSGEVRSLVTERSIDYGLRDRQQEQLCLQESAMAEVLGPAVISDAALVGTDMFQRDGAGMGILFEARNSTLLANDIRSDRADALKADPTAVDEQVTIGGHKASFLHTPDNRLRSYYLIIDHYHLVTTSRTIAERFAEVAKDGKSLGKTEEFRHARSLFPTDRNDTVFVYLSSPFLQNLVSPRFQVELQRRLHSLAELEVLGVARAEAQARGARDVSLEGLRAAGVLPPGFGERADGSQLVEKDGQVIDSVRGPRGMFVPVADIPIEHITAAESAECLQVARKYAATWEQMTPIVAAVSRSNGAREGLEQVSLDLRMTPLAARQYEFLASQLGSPSRQRLAPIRGDVAAFDAVLSRAFGGNGEDYHLFGGVRNVDPRIISGTLLEKMLGMFGGREVEGYLGAWPRPGALWLLGATANAPIDERGYSQFLTGSWRRIVDQFTLMSFHRELLDEITPQLRFIPVDRPAQAWLYAADLRESRLAPALNAYGYAKAVERSRGNARFLNSMVDQLQLPPAEALKTAEALLSAKLVCPLGGTYELVGADTRHPQWVSNAKIAGGGAPPEDYEFPALYWLRGVEADVRLTQEELAIHADIQMPVKTRASSFQLPAFNLPFGQPKAVPAEGGKTVEPAKPQASGRPREF